MKNKVKETVDQFLKDVTPYGRKSDYILFEDWSSARKVPHLNWYIYTNDHIYSISASFDKKPIEANWFGCTVSSRKPRAGVVHTTGNDLPDGSLNLKTWTAIKNAIIKYELVKLWPGRKYLGEEDK